MSDTPEVINARVDKDQHKAFAEAAQRAGLSKSEAIRILIDRAVEQASSGAAPRIFQSDEALLQAFREDYAIFAIVGDALLEKRYDLISAPHRAEILREIGVRRDLVSVVADAQRLDFDKRVDCTELLCAHIDNFLRGNPGALFFSVPADDILTLALRDGGRW